MTGNKRQSSFYCLNEVERSFYGLLCVIACMNTFPSVGWLVRWEAVRVVRGKGTETVSADSCVHPAQNKHA